MRIGVINYSCVTFGSEQELLDYWASKKMTPIPGRPMRNIMLTRIDSRKRSWQLTASVGNAWYTTFACPSVSYAYLVWKSKMELPTVDLD